MLGALRTDGIVEQTANGGEIGVSAGADSRFGACGGVPELFEARVRPQSVSDVLRALRLQAVVAEAAKGVGIGVSAGADSKSKHFWPDAHLMDCKVVLALSISAIWMMPSAV